MRLFRTICRVDYKVSFAEIDRLGMHTQFFHDRTLVAPFKDVKSNLNILTHSTSAEGKVEGRPFKFNLTPKNLDFTVEYPEGISVERLGGTKLLDLLAELLPKMAPQHQYERIGMRSFVLATGGQLKFRPVLGLLMDRLGSLKEPLLKGASAADIGCVLEIDDKHGRHGRIMFGPYQPQEWPKYLEHQPEPAVGEGMVFDIDTSMAKMEMVKFDLAKFANAHQLMVREIAGGVLSRIEGELT